jgi:hypothetical protein
VYKNKARGRRDDDCAPIWELIRVEKEKRVFRALESRIAENPWAASRRPNFALLLVLIPGQIYFRNGDYMVSKGYV